MGQLTKELLQNLDERDRTARTVGFLGQTQSGKTWLMRDVIRATSHKYPNTKWFIWDPNASFLYGKMRGGAFHHGVGSLDLAQSKIYTDPADVADISRVRDDVLAPYRYYIWNGLFDFYEHFTDISVQIGGVVLVVDEIDKVVPKSTSELQARRPYFVDIVNRGRHIPDYQTYPEAIAPGVSLFWACQRIGRTNLDVIAGTKTAFILANPSARDREVLHANYGDFDDKQIATFCPLSGHKHYIRKEGYKFFVGKNDLVVDGMTVFKPR